MIPIARPRVDKQLGWVGAESGRVHFSRISTSSPWKKFAGPWPRACQIIDPWTLTMSNILFAGLIPKWTILKAKINIEPQLLQLLLLLLLLLLKLLFLVQKRAREGGLSGSPGPWS